MMQRSADLVAIEELNGGFVVKVGRTRSIENRDSVATIILNHWPDVALRIAKAWRPAEEEVA